MENNLYSKDINTKVCDAVDKIQNCIISTKLGCSLFDNLIT